MNRDIEAVGLGIPYEGWIVGRKLKTIGRTVTDADITQFVNATGMVEVLFTNREHLQEAGLYSGRPAPGLMVQAFAEGLVLQCTLQHTGLAFLGGETAVRSPCLVGDTIHVVTEVVATRPTSKSDRGIVVTRNQVMNQKGVVVLDYSATRLVRSAANQPEVATDE